MPSQAQLLSAFVPPTHTPQDPYSFNNVGPSNTFYTSGKPPYDFGSSYSTVSNPRPSSHSQPTHSSFLPSSNLTGPEPEHHRRQRCFTPVSKGSNAHVFHPEICQGTYRSDLPAIQPQTSLSMNTNPALNSISNSNAASSCDPGFPPIPTQPAPESDDRSNGNGIVGGVWEMGDSTLPYEYFEFLLHSSFGEYAGPIDFDALLAPAPL